MKPTIPTTEDMFEKAREAFFGTTAKTSLPEPNETLAEPLKPQNEYSTT